MKTSHLLIGAAVVGVGIALYMRSSKTAAATAAVTPAPNFISRAAATIDGYVSKLSSKVNAATSSITSVTSAAQSGTTAGTAAVSDGPDIESHVGTMA